MERKVSTRKYILAFILTIIIFAGGVVLGIKLEGARLNDAQQITLQEKTNLLSLQLQQKYIESGRTECTALNQILEANINELGKKMATIIEYEKKSILNEQEFRVQLRDYFLTEIQFLLISEEINHKCKTDNIKIIYFYDENEFDTQGKILDYLKDVFKNEILVFSFDSGFQEEPMISVLLNSYGIKKFPAVVIESTVFQGHTDVETLKQSICWQFKQRQGIVPEQCKD